MSKYIWKQIVCDHPLVKRVWQTGSLAEYPPNAIAICNSHLEFNDGSRKDFENDIDYKKAEEYLQLLK